MIVLGAGGPGRPAGCWGRRTVREYMVARGEREFGGGSGTGGANDYVTFASHAPACRNVFSSGHQLIAGDDLRVAEVPAEHLEGGPLTEVIFELAIVASDS